MLGLKDPKDDSFCEYERRSVVTKQKKVKPEISQKENLEHVISTARKSAYDLAENTSAEDQGFKGQSSSITVQAQDVKNEKPKEEKGKVEENSISFCSSSEHNEENSKAFMESIGSWINDLFSAPNKRSPSSSEAEKGDYQKESVLEEDAEYLKSICAIKEQFRKKLKSETSVHVSAPDKPFEFNFDKVLDNNKRNKKRTKSLPSTSDPEWLEELGDFDGQVTEASDNLMRRNNPNASASGLIIRTGEAETHRKPLSSKNSLDLNSSTLIKEKRKTKGKNRYELSELEEYVFPTPAELSKRILLNVNDQDKCVQFYKNTHLGVQETQHYGQGKKKAYQTNARCYTTNANPSENSENLPSKPCSTLNRFSHYCTTDAAEMRGADEILSKNSLDFRKNQNRKPSRKVISELSRDSMSFIKVKSPKSLTSIQLESAKGDAKTSSDELVKYLMKKIKTNHRPHQAKKKGSINVPQVLSSPKNRFMQSATNTLVMSVMAKSDNQFSAKNSPRAFTENRLYPAKDLLAKYPDNNVRFDVSRAMSHPKFSKCTYLLESDKMEDDTYALDKNSLKNTKRPYEDLLKRDTKKQSNKYNKRQEIKNMFSKIDMKFNMFQTSKARPREPKKRPIQSTLENFDSAETKEAQNARFQKQHELFKTNLKLVMQNSSTDASPASSEKENENQAVSASANLLSTELAVIDPNLQLSSNTPQEKNEVVAVQPSKIAEPTTMAASSAPKEPEYKIVDCLALADKPANLKVEKKVPEKSVLNKDKLYKAKSIQFIKENDSKLLLSPLAEYCNSENQNQKDTSKAYETPLCPGDLRPAKAAETVLFNRRYSTNTLNEMSQKPKSVPWSPQPYKNNLYLTDLEKEVKKDEKEVKDKKVKSPKMSDSSEVPLGSGCGLEKVIKKPGPNCEENE